MLAGSLEEGDRHHDLGPGLVTAVGVARQWRPRGAWFLTGTFALAASSVITQEGGGASTPLYALDGRAGLQAGRAFGPLSPYLLARAFGGPVWWTSDEMDVTGSDVYHFQLGLGASVTAGSVTFVVDAALLGEMSASLSMALQL